MKEQILRIINSFNFEQKEGRLIETNVWNETYSYNLLKSKFIAKNKAALQAHSLDFTDEILLLFQNGMTEKDSMVLTDKFISIAESNWFSKNIVSKIYWDSISNIQFLNHSLVFTMKDGTVQTFDVERVFAKNKIRANTLVELLQRILRITQGEKETLVKINDKQVDLQKHKKFIYTSAGILVLIILGLSYYLWSKPETTNSVSTIPIGNLQDTKPKAPESDTIWSDKPQKDFTKAIKLNTINVFNEPYEITMEAHKIAGLIYTNGDRVIIPVEIPPNTINWIYRIRLENAKIASGYTPLIKEVEEENNGWTVLDLVNPINKEEFATKMATQILNKIDEPSKEKPFTNIYFINKEKEAKKFQSGLPFESDINYSIKNTHSRNGLMKFNQNKFVYLGLENDGFSDDIYVSLEVVALTENIKYFKVVKK